MSQYASLLLPEIPFLIAGPRCDTSQDAAASPAYSEAAPANPGSCPLTPLAAVSTENWVNPSNSLEALEEAGMPFRLLLLALCRLGFPVAHICMSRGSTPT